MIDHITTSDNRLSLTDVELALMNDMLARHDRAGFYILYNAMTDSSQISVQARISTFSGPTGGGAFVANRLMQELFAPDGMLPAALGNAAYSGVYQLSQDVAVEAFNLISMDAANPDGFAGLGGANAALAGDAILQSAELAWINANNLAYFPGNLLTPVSVLVTAAGALYELITDIFGADDLENIEITGEGVDQFVDALGDTFFQIISPGTFASIAAALIFEDFDKSPSALRAAGLTEVRALNGIKLYVNSDGKVEGVSDPGLADAAVLFLRGVFLNTAIASVAGTVIYNVLQEILQSLVERPLDSAFNPAADFTELNGSGADGDTQSFDPAQSIADAPTWSENPTSNSDILSGSDGFLGFGGKDNIDAGDGNDVVFGGKGADIIDGNVGNDILWGQQGNDELIGGDGDDILRGGSGDDRLVGGMGNDLLDGGDIRHAAGDDGEDTADYSENEERIFFDLSGLTQEEIDAGFLIIADDGTGGTDTLHSIERIIATEFDDVFVVPYELSALGLTLIDFGMGDDVLDFSGDIDGVSFDPASGEVELLSIEQIILTDFADTIVFNLLIDDGQTAFVYAGGEDDSITITNDSVDGGVGLFVAGDGSDFISVTSVNQSVRNIILGENGNDTIDVISGFNDIYGGDGDDNIMSLQDSPSYIFGGAGNDTITLGHRGGHGFGGAGSDTVNSGTNSSWQYDLYGTFSNNLVDTLVDSGNAAPSPLIFQDDGETDTLVGGVGVDVFHVGNGDIIRNFDQSRDKIIFYFPENFSAFNIGRELGVFDGLPTRLDGKLSLQVVQEGNQIAIGIGVNNNNPTTISELVNFFPFHVIFEGTDINDVFFALSPSSTVSGFNYEIGPVDLSQNDTLQGKGDITPSVMELPTNEILGTIADNTIVGTNIGDAIYAGGGIDIVSAGDGNDIVYGGYRNDILDGGDGNDVLYGEEGNDNLDGEAGDDTLFGGSGRDFMTGGTGDDILFGGRGNDLLQGNAGADHFIGGRGSDTLNGSSGDGDIADFSDLDGNVTVLLDAINTFSGTAVAGRDTDIINNIANIIGTNYDDSIRAQLNPGTGVFNENIFYGGEGNDLLDGGLANDQLFGEGGDDELIGGTQDDWLNGGAGADILNGGSGVDTASYSTATTGVSVDLVSGVSSGEALGDTFLSIERFEGSQFNDTFTGANGQTNTFFGLAGNDSFTGGELNDTFEGGEGSDNYNWGLGKA